VEVNGFPVGHRVQTEVDACGCAGGPNTWTWEAYQSGAFRPANAPGRVPGCSPSKLTGIADFWEVQVLHFDRAACADGWALAIGTGAGFTGPIVGLFDRGYRPGEWQLLTLDNGNALPAAPAIYDLPLPLLVSLAAHLGSSLAAPIDAAQLVARLQSRYGFSWAQQNGIVSAGGADWVIAVVPARRASNGYSPFPAAAIIYRWDGHTWSTDGRIAKLPESLNVDWNGGWFVGSSPTASASVVTFGLADSLSPTKDVITNRGGSWHVASR
jgi:hypothetical protein